MGFHGPSKCYQQTVSLLHGLPKIIRVEEPGESWVHIENMNVAFLVVPDHRFVVVACAIGLDFNSKGSVHFKL